MMSDHKKLKPGGALLAFLLIAACVEQTMKKIPGKGE
jgi:hypothetical protein